MTPDLLDGDDHALPDVYHRGYAHGFKTAQMQQAALGTPRHERRLAAAWCAVGVVVGLFLAGWLA